MLVLKYWKNESLTQINIKQLGDCKHSCYPATTFCLYSDNGNLMTKLDSLTRRKCYESLNGKMNDTIDLEICDVSNLSLPAKSYFNNITFEYTDETKLNYELENITHTYIDPDDQCFTIQTNPKLSASISRINFELNAEQLSSLSGGSLKVFLHHPGQFLRNSLQFRNPVYYIKTLNPLTVRARSDIAISTTHIVVTINRKDGETECNDIITNHDEYWLNELRKLVGCNPPYWKSIWNVEEFSECNDSISLQRFYEFHMALSKPYTSNKVREMLDVLREELSVPCNFMELSTKWESTNADDTTGNTIDKSEISVGEISNGMASEARNITSGMAGTISDTMNIEVLFAISTYEERQELRAYEASSLFAEMGGYIGLFLGLSVLQGLSHVLELVVRIRKLFF